MAVTLEDVRQIALSLPRAYEAQVREATKFRVRQIVFAAVSPDETRLGFGFPREERAGLVAAEPDKFLLPRPSDRGAPRADHRCLDDVRAQVGGSGVLRRSEPGAGLSNPIPELGELLGDPHRGRAAAAGA
jgi:hypothetical protein